MDNCSYFHFENGSRVVFRLRNGDIELITKDIEVDIYSVDTDGQELEKTISLDKFLFNWITLQMKDMNNVRTKN